MPLYIISQIKRNSIQIFQCVENFFITIWSFIDKYSTKFASCINNQIVARINRKAHKYKRCLKIFAIIVAILALITALFMASFKSAGARQQGLEINYTQEVLKQQYYTNDWKYTGLNGYIEVIPKQKILIQFTSKKQIPDEQEKVNQIYNAIEARVSEGTKLSIESTLECKIVVKDNKIKQFFDQYGFDQTPGHQSELQWMTYMKQKAMNIIVQTFSTKSFYNITTKSLKQELNSKFYEIASIVGYPFNFVVLSLTINYPQNSFPINNTLGIQVLRVNSLLKQFQSQYSRTQSYIIKQKPRINQTYINNIILKAGIDSNLLNIRSYNNWINGLSLAKNMLNSNTSSGFEAKLEKYLWVYFNNLYNQTYRQQKRNSTKNLSGYDTNMQLQMKNTFY